MLSEKKTFGLFKTQPWSMDFINHSL